MILLVAFCTIACSSSDDSSNNDDEQTFSEIIVGKWKLTRQEETINGEVFTTDFTNSTGETTHEYFSDGSMIFHEWGETFSWRYRISGAYLIHIQKENELKDNKILLLKEDEMALELPDNDDTPRRRYYIKLY